MTCAIGKKGCECMTMRIETCEPNPWPSIADAMSKALDQVIIDDANTCHCGRPGLKDSRGMCRDCDACRCDAYPQECPFRDIPDPVNHPDHYKWLPVEVIEITEHFSFTLGNVLKYVMRADHKGKPLEDLKKARFYLNREIARREA